MIIVIGGKKGGTGKSNLAYNLAGAYKHLQRKVLIIDGDDNATCVNKSNRRKELLLDAEDRGDTEAIKALSIMPVQGVNSSSDIRVDLREASTNYQVVIVDTGGFETKAFKSAVMVADHIIVPTQLSQDDIEQLDPLFEWLREQEADLQLKSPDLYLNISAVFSRVHGYQNSDKTEAKEFLEDYSDLINISNVAIKEKADVRKLTKPGMTYHDVMHKERASFELLIDELEGNRPPLSKRNKAVS